MRRQVFAARVWAKLLAHEKEHQLLAPGQRVLAAISGGPDSVCLAHYLAQRARPLRLKVTLFHVHHGLRGKAADSDQAFVKKLGRSLGLEVACVKVDARAAAVVRGGGLEDAARKLRYASLTVAARRGRFHSVATGHQLDDQAETVLLNLLRGTRLEALGGIAPRRPLTASIALIRPLLPLTRDEVTLYLKRHALPSRLDRSNREEAFLRNWLRRRVIPLLETRQPRVREHLSGLAAQVRDLT